MHQRLDCCFCNMAAGIRWIVDDHEDVDRPQQPRNSLKSKCFNEIWLWATENIVNGPASPPGLCAMG